MFLVLVLFGFVSLLSGARFCCVGGGRKNILFFLGDRLGSPPLQQPTPQMTAKVLFVCVCLGEQELVRLKCNNKKKGRELESWCSLDRQRLRLGYWATLAPRCHR